MRWIPALLICFLAACRHQPQAYTLARQGRSQLLTPPPSRPEIKKARRHGSRTTGCDIESGSFSLMWRGNTARVAMRSEAYYAPPEASAPQTGTAGITVAESGPRIYSDSLAQLEAFREALSAKEDAGCLRDADGARLRQAITETFPFPPQIAAYLRFGTYTFTGSIDLMPGFLLRVVSPAATDPDVSFYTIAGEAGGERVRVSLLSGAGSAMTIPENPAFYRYLYWTGASPHNFRTTILAAPDRKTLHDATSQFLSDPESFCAKPGPGVFCQSVAASVGMNVGFYIRVNGSDVFVRMGGTISEAVGEARNGLRVAGRQPLPQNVSVRRMFHGKLIPIKVVGAPTDILGLVAMPGDEITF
jgi:hypothetical protein